MMLPVDFPGKDVAATVDAQAPSRRLNVHTFIFLPCFKLCASPALFLISADFESCASRLISPEESIKILLVK